MELRRRKLLPEHKRFVRRCSLMLQRAGGNACPLKSVFVCCRKLYYRPRMRRIKLTAAFQNRPSEGGRGIAPLCSTLPHGLLRNPMTESSAKLRLFSASGGAPHQLKGKDHPIIEQRRGRGGSRGSCGDRRGRRCSGSQTGSTSRCRPNCRHGPRGASLHYRGTHA